MALRLKFFTVEILANLRLTVNFFSSFLKEQFLRLGIFFKPIVKIQLLRVMATFCLAV